METLNIQDYDLNPIDILGYISSSNINSNEIKNNIQTFFSQNSIRINSEILNKLIILLEEIIDDNNHDTIKKYNLYLKETYNLVFIREHMDEIILFDEDISNLDIDVN